MITTADSAPSGYRQPGPMTCSDAAQARLAGGLPAEPAGICAVLACALCGRARH